MAVASKPEIALDDDEGEEDNMPESVSSETGVVINAATFELIGAVTNTPKSELIATDCQSWLTCQVSSKEYRLFMRQPAWYRKRKNGQRNVRRRTSNYG